MNKLQKKAMIHVPDECRKKWSSKSEERIFVGYSEEAKAYRVMDPVTKRVTNARSVVFLENELKARETNVPMVLFPVVPVAEQQGSSQECDNSSAGSDAENRVDLQQDA